MTIATSNVVNTFLGDASTKIFTFTMAVQAAADLKVYLGSVLQSTSAYSVSITNTLAGLNGTANGQNVGGKITFVTAPGSNVVGTIVNDPGISQSFSPPIDGNFNEASMENAWDKLTLIAQYLRAFALQSSPLSAALGVVRAGTATFVSAGSVDVTDAATTANSIILITEEGASAADRYSVVRTAGSKFTIHSSNASSAAKVDYIAIG